VLELPFSVIYRFVILDYSKTLLLCNHGEGERGVGGVHEEENMHLNSHLELGPGEGGGLESQLV
jgi:hypothetical protein